jgi:hypothetical protein
MPELSLTAKKFGSRLKRHIQRRKSEAGGISEKASRTRQQRQWRSLGEDDI